MSNLNQKETNAKEVAEEVVGLIIKYAFCGWVIYAGFYIIIQMIQFGVTELFF